MATNPVNNQVSKKAGGYKWPIDTGGSFDINQGDLVWFDTAVHELKPLASDANAATFAGVAADSSYLSLYASSAGAAIKKYSDDGLMVFTEGVYFFFTTAADVYHPGDPVYQVTGKADTITNIIGANTKVLGYVWFASSASTTTVTGAAGVTVGILIVPLWPSTGLA